MASRPSRILAPIALVAALSLSGCGSGANDLTGDWKMVNSEDIGFNHRATITDDTITVDWVNEKGKRDVYWVGNYDAPDGSIDTDEEPYSWTSRRDKAATDDETLSNKGDTMEFTVWEGELVYDAMTGNARMERD